MDVKTCSYTYLNDTKKNKKGELCTTRIKNEDESLCWRHRGKKNTRNPNEKDKDKNSDIKPDKQIEIIQLQNS